MNPYFLTDFDPDYHIKGSRDPLGFQTIWQKTGRLVIPHLSTISVHLKDFQILAFALLYEKKFKIEDEGFWLRFEQLMAYVRKNMGDDIILGKTRVNKNWDTKKLEISGKIDNDIILVNQRATGIRGRYISPFNKTKIQDNDAFKIIFEQKLHDLKDNGLLKKFATTKNEFSVPKTILKDFEIILHLSVEEKHLWWKFLLETNEDLLKQIQQMDEKGYLKSNSNNFYEWIDVLKQDAASQLKRHLDEIKQTERVLCPINRIFRYLQTKHFWHKHEIENDPFIKKCNNVHTIDKAYFTVEKTEKDTLYGLLEMTNQWELVKKIVERNEMVMASRGSKAWIILTEDAIEVLHREGESSNYYDPEKHSDNSYFLNTYIGFYQVLSAK